MRKQKIIISQTTKEQNQLEIEQLAKDQECQLAEAIIDWMEDKDIDYFDFPEYVSEVLISRLERESINRNVVKDDNPDKRTHLHQLFLEL